MSRANGSTKSTASIKSDQSDDPAGTQIEVTRPWKFTQWFKKMPVEDSLPESDLLSAVEFDRTGEFLATGDRGGRVVVLRADDSAKGGKLHYKFHCEYQSHEVDFDYVRSQTIEEKINKIKWLEQTNNSQFMLTTNDRAIKLYKLHEKEMFEVKGFNVTGPDGQLKSKKKVTKLQLPKLKVAEALVVASPKRQFASDIHKFSIHSLCVSSDNETFLSADNLSINLWHVDHTRVAFNLVNIKPVDMSKLTDVITCAETDRHNLFMYATNHGVVRLGDLREKALNDVPKRCFSDPALESGEHGYSAATANRPYLAEMLRSVSDVKFSPCGRKIVSRDYMCVKIWDMAMEKKPLDVIPVHDYLSPKLWDLFENECMYDCFDVSINARGDILTGSYNNFFHIYDFNQKSDTLLEASKPPVSTTRLVSAANPLSQLEKERSTKALNKKKRNSRPGLVSLLGRKKKTKEVQGTHGLPDDFDLQQINFDDRVMQLAWHPNCDAVATASNNNLYVYSRPKESSSSSSS